MSHTHWSDSEEISSHASCWTMSKRTFFLLVVLGFCAMWQEADAEIILDKPVLSGPSNSTLGSVEEFYCKLDNITTNQTILYQLFNKGNLNKILGEYSAQNQQEATFLFVINLDLDGQLICKASVQNNSKINSTNSDWMKFQVIVPVKGAHIISSPSLEDLWEGDSLTLRCNITEGNFVLYDWLLDDNPLLNDSSNSHLLIPSLSSKNKGKYVCVAKNDYNETLNYTNKSEGVDVHVKVFNKISTELAAIVFTCFSLLICAVLACCVYGVVLRKRQARKYIFRLKDFTDKHSIVDDDGDFNKTEETGEDEYEEEEYDDLDTEAYIEDTDVVQASMMEDFYEEL